MAEKPILLILNRIVFEEFFKANPLKDLLFGYFLASSGCMTDASEISKSVMLPFSSGKDTTTDELGPKLLNA